MRDEEWTDERLREHADAARQRVTLVYDLEEQPKREPVALSEITPRIPSAEPTGEPAQAQDSWEPTCVSCGALLGYLARSGSYAEGKTECATCRNGSIATRLTASGISFREIDPPLGALIRPCDDPANADLDAKTIRERTQEFDRYLAFLQRFAALRPGQRIDPPFAFVFGNVGTGKSAGAERALRDAIRNGGCSGRVVRFSDLVRKIYDTYRRDEESRDLRTEDILRTYSSVHLLVIHEIGPDAETDHALGLFFDFVDARHQAKLPTIFTSNYAPDQESLGARMGGRASDEVRVRGILDRISGGVRENVFCLRGPSWRGREPVTVPVPMERT